MRLPGDLTPVQPMLETRRAERAALLRRVQAALVRDERVVAAWLFGSLGRGEEDDLSDLDLFIVVADAHADAVMAERYDFLNQWDPVLILDAPQNRPPQGAYQMALYPGQYGQQQVDWYWQPQSVARIPQQTRLLLDRVGLPRLDGPPHFDYQPVPERPRLEILSQSANFFWVMLLITAKYAARSPEEAEMGLLPYILAPLRELQTFVGRDPLPGSVIPTHPQPEAKIALLRALAAQMESLMPPLAAAGIQVPTAIVPEAYCYLDLIAAILQGRA